MRLASGTFLGPSVFTFGLIVGVSGFLLKVHHYVCVQGDPIKLTQGRSLSACVDLCNCITNCSFFTYRKTYHICSVYDSRSDKRKRNNCVGYVMIERNETANFAGQTSLSECTKNDTVACPNIKDTDSQKVLGNMNSIGYKRKIVCKEGYAMDGPEYTTCLDTGDWTDYGSCTRVCRGFKEYYVSVPIMNISIPTNASGLRSFSSLKEVNLPFFEGSTITLVSSNTTKTSDHQGQTNCVNGLWTDLGAGSIRIGQDCYSECDNANLSCNSSRCWCRELMFYDPCSSSCVQACTNGFGDTYQVREGVAILGSNEIFFYSSTSECIRNCTANTDLSDYVCAFADYNTRSNRCNLNKKVTYAINDLKEKEKENRILFQRNCAVCSNYT